MATLDLYLKVARDLNLIENDDILSLSQNVQKSLDELCNILETLQSKLGLYSVLFPDPILTMIANRLIPIQAKLKSIEAFLSGQAISQDLEKLNEIITLLEKVYAIKPLLEVLIKYYESQEFDSLKTLFQEAHSKALEILENDELKITSDDFYTFFPSDAETLSYNSYLQLIKFRDFLYTSKSNYLAFLRKYFYNANKPFDYIAEFKKVLETLYNKALVLDEHIASNKSYTVVAAFFGLCNRLKNAFANIYIPKLSTLELKSAYNKLKTLIPKLQQFYSENKDLQAYIYSLTKFDIPVIWYPFLTIYKALLPIYQYILVLREAFPKNVVDYLQLYYEVASAINDLRKYLEDATVLYNELRLGLQNELYAEFLAEINKLKQSNLNTIDLQLLNEIATIVNFNLDIAHNDLYQLFQAQILAFLFLPFEYQISYETFDIAISNIEQVLEKLDLLQSLNAPYFQTPTVTQFAPVFKMYLDNFNESHLSEFPQIYSVLEKSLNQLIDTLHTYIHALYPYANYSRLVNNFLNYTSMYFNPEFISFLETGINVASFQISFKDILFSLVDLKSYLDKWLTLEEALKNLYHNSSGFFDTVKLIQTQEAFDVQKAEFLNNFWKESYNYFRNHTLTLHLDEYCNTIHQLSNFHECILPLSYLNFEALEKLEQILQFFDINKIDKTISELYTYARNLSSIDVNLITDNYEKLKELTLEPFSYNEWNLILNQMYALSFLKHVLPYSEINSSPENLYLTLKQIVRTVSKLSFISPKVLETLVQSYNQNRYDIKQFYPIHIIITNLKRTLAKYFVHTLGLNDTYVDIIVGSVKSLSELYEVCPTLGYNESKFANALALFKRLCDIEKKFEALFKFCNTSNLPDTLELDTNEIPNVNYNALKQYIISLFEMLDKEWWHLFFDKAKYHYEAFIQLFANNVLNVEFEYDFALSDIVLYEVNPMYDYHDSAFGIIYLNESEVSDELLGTNTYILSQVVNYGLNEIGSDLETILQDIQEYLTYLQDIIKFTESYSCKLFVEFIQGNRDFLYRLRNYSSYYDFYKATPSFLEEIKLKINPNMLPQLAAKLKCYQEYCEILKQLRDKLKQWVETYPNQEYLLASQQMSQITSITDDLYNLLTQLYANSSILTIIVLLKHVYNLIQTVIEQLRQILQNLLDFIQAFYDNLASILVTYLNSLASNYLLASLLFNPNASSSLLTLLGLSLFTTLCNQDVIAQINEMFSNLASDGNVGTLTAYLYENNLITKPEVELFDESIFETYPYLEVIQVNENLAIDYNDSKITWFNDKPILTFRIYAVHYHNDRKVLQSLGYGVIDKDNSIYLLEKNPTYPKLYPWNLYEMVSLENAYFRVLPINETYGLLFNGTIPLCIYNFETKQVYVDQSWNDVSYLIPKVDFSNAIVSKFYGPFGIAVNKQAYLTDKTFKDKSIYLVDVGFGFYLIDSNGKAFYDSSILMNTYSQLYVDLDNTYQVNSYTYYGVKLLTGLNLTHETYGPFAIKLGNQCFLVFNTSLIASQNVDPKVYLGNNLLVDNDKLWIGFIRGSLNYIADENLHTLKLGTKEYSLKIRAPVLA